MGQRAIVKDDPLKPRGYLCVAWVGATTGYSEKDPEITARHDANAHLIARAPSMLALLKKALPIIENEAELREASMVRHGEDKCVTPYWSEMRQLANTIQAEIAKAKGDPVIDAELCPHGFGFVEYCEECNQKEIKAKWREKEDSHG
jgi:ribosomal protein L11